MKKIKITYEILVINDNSSDNSCKLLTRLNDKYGNVRHIDRFSEKGVGRTLREGFRNAKGKFVVTIDADLSHNPRYIADFYEKVKEGHDLVVGSRYIKNGKMDNTSERKFISKAFTFFARMFGLKIHDATSGFRIQRRLMIDALSLESTGFEIHAEIPLKATKRGYSVSEIPIEYARRKYGKSNLNYLREGPKYLKVLLKSLFF